MTNQAHNPTNVKALENIIRIGVIWKNQGLTDTVIKHRFRNSILKNIDRPAEVIERQIDNIMELVNIKMEEAK